METVVIYTVMVFYCALAVNCVMVTGKCRNMQQCRLYRGTVVIYTVMVLLCIGCKLCDGDRTVSKHVAVQIVQGDGCDLYSYGIICIGCKLCDGDRTVSKHVAVQIVQGDCCDLYCYGIIVHWL